jgi:mannose-6-phosphate isomerase-like protein (cupin superfamily)
VRVIDVSQNPVVPTPDHTGATSQEIAGQTLGAKTCDVKISTYDPGGRCAAHAHPRSEHVLYILEGQLTVIDGAKNEATAFAGQAVYIPAGELHWTENRGAVPCRYVAVTAPPPA